MSLVGTDPPAEVNFFQSHDLALGLVAFGLDYFHNPSEKLTPHGKMRPFESPPHIHWCNIALDVPRDLERS